MKKIPMLFSVLVGGVMLASCMQPQVNSDLQSSSVWVCHGEQDRRWQRVNASDGDSHRGHGDRVTSHAQNEGQACDNSSDREDRR
jgi:hypothetical protein